MLQDVCDRAEGSRATAYRGSPSFKSEFDQRIGAMRGGLSMFETECVNMIRSNTITHRQRETLKRQRDMARPVVAAIVAAAGDGRVNPRG